MKISESKLSDSQKGHHGEDHKAHYVCRKGDREGRFLRAYFAIRMFGVLILGLGMSFVMSDLAKVLGDYQNLAMSLGIVIGIVGIILVGLAYPMYNLIMIHERKKIAAEVIRLADELLK